MSVLNFFFDVDGRVGRIGFLIGIGIITLFLVVATAVILVIPNGAIQGILAFIFVVAALISLNAFTERRCHDFGKQSLIESWKHLIPIIGPVWACVVMFFEPGNIENNKYGDVPRF